MFSCVSDYIEDPKGTFSSFPHIINILCSLWGVVAERGGGVVDNIALYLAGGVDYGGKGLWGWRLGWEEEDMVGKCAPWRDRCGGSVGGKVELMLRSCQGLILNAASIFN